MAQSSVKFSNGVNPRRVSAPGYVTTFAPGAGQVFVAPKAGLYEVAGWSSGCAPLNAGNSYSGGLGIKRKRLRRGDRVLLSVSESGLINTSSGGGGVNTNTVVTFPDGSVMTVAASTASAAGTSTGGDVNITGNSANPAVGAAAPSYGTYRGGAAPPDFRYANSPGGGGIVGTGRPGGAGLVIVSRVR